MKEVTNPTRIVTTTVRVKNGSMPVVSVKTAQDIPKEKIFDCVEALRDVCVEAPVQIGDVILENAAGTGVDIVATGNVKQIIQCSAKEIYGDLYAYNMSALRQTKRIK